MIGGFDISLPLRLSARDISLMLDVVAKRWPDGLVELGDGTLTARVGTAASVLELHPGHCDVFIHQTRETLKSWTLEGATELNCDSMVAMTVHHDGVHFVVSAKHSYGSLLVSKMIDAVQQAQPKRPVLSLEDEHKVHYLTLGGWFDIELLEQDQIVKIEMFRTAAMERAKNRE